jgi:sulfur-carrier protein
MPTVSFTRALERFLPVPSTAVDGTTVGAALAAVFRDAAGIARLCARRPRRLAPHVAVYVNGRLVNDRTGLSDPVGPRDEIYVFQALSGG